MDFWCGVAITLIAETAALIAGVAWLERKTREMKGENDG